MGTGGAERVLYLLCQNLQSKMDIKVITLSSGSYVEKINDLGIEVIVLKLDSIFGFCASFLKVIRLTIKFQPDTIQGWMYHGNLFSHILRLFSPNSKLYLGIRQSLPDIKLEKKCTQIAIKLDSLLARFSSLVIYNSYKGQKDHLEFGYKQNNIVIPNGVDTEKFKPQAIAKEDLCKKLKIPNDSTLIGIIARFHPVKDHETFIKAAAEFSEINPNAHYILSGQQIDASNQKINNIIANYPELNGKVHLLGAVEKIESITSALDISVNCSLSEGMPNNVIEAMASGAIVTVTDVGDSKIIVNNDLLITPTSSPSSLCQTWQKVLELDKASITSKLVKRAREKFSLNTMISNFEKIYLDA